LLLLSVENFSGGAEAERSIGGVTFWPKVVAGSRGPTASSVSPMIEAVKPGALEMSKS
jgi:hypothetical protein